MINIKNMDFAYKKANLFSGLSLELNSGNIYGLLRKNAAGKTSLLKSYLKSQQLIQFFILKNKLTVIELYWPIQIRIKQLLTLKHSSIL